ncbi:MAG: preprotein translocase subunit SecA [SAR202 cluster bacterium]|nr:preprotein translocase subunit SecA [SAR202 cluster bacterium]|tara:strand:- start:5930 stop:8575 length:2646 start_codon:yes stop_codon:yes gene_type:complete
MLKRIGSLLGGSQDRSIKKLSSLVDEVDALEPDFEKLPDDLLYAKTTEFQSRYKNGEHLDSLLPEAFATVRETAKRMLGQRHYRVQIMGGIVLHQGKIAEMKTGEGKTLVSTLAVYLNALTGDGVHLVTVNDYLARRDCQWMGPIYNALGLTVGCLQNEGSFLFGMASDGEAELEAAHRSDVYSADVVYGTNSEFGFDYLRDNMALEKDSMVQKKISYAIVDEVDNILVDEARTPLIISGPSDQPDQTYYKFADIARSLDLEMDYVPDEKARSVALTDAGITHIETSLGISNLYAPENYRLTHYVENALKAEVFYLRDQQYVVQDGKATIVDEFTGRLMTGRRFGEGLHQAIEAKEGLQIQQETITLATITLQNYFRLYDKLSGMTGTAITESEEFWKIYGLEVLTIPTNKPLMREDLSDTIYLNEKEKYTAVADAIADLHKTRRPVLVGTVSVERSEQLGKLLKERGVEHQVLNAKFHEQEAEIVAQAGRLGGVTVATNMAGRGTDIILGGSQEKRDPGEWQNEHDEVIKLGGLYIIGTELHESRRIDNQLRGRAGRQGDPGTSVFYVALDDELIRRFGGDRVRGLLNWAGVEEGEAIDNRMVRKAFENAQVKVEAHNFEIRKHLVEYDDVINTQRDVIYEQRFKVLDQTDVHTNIKMMIDKSVADIVDDYLPDLRPETWDLEGLLVSIQNLFGATPEWANYEAMNLMSQDEIIDQLNQFATELYANREDDNGSEVTRDIERVISLRTVDSHWIEHLTVMDMMRRGIGLEAVAQRDPLVAYRMEAHRMYQELQENIQHSIVRNMYHVSVVGQKIDQQMDSPLAQHQRNSSGEAPIVANQPAGDSPSVRTVTRTQKKIGRNESCPCGSGKKYKNCHWPEAV